MAGMAAVEEASMRDTSNQDRAQQLQHLEEAERHKRLIAEQERRLNELRRGGHDVAEAEKFLQRLRETQEQYAAHRKLTLSELERAEHSRNARKLTRPIRKLTATWEEPKLFADGGIPGHHVGRFAACQLRVSIGPDGRCVDDLTVGVFHHDVRE
jgi:hypothetical protein